MEYSKLVAVTGMPGLYELINSKNDGAIVRSLDDNTTKFASSRIHNFSHLESIEVYTVNENVNLVDVFHAMEKAGDALPDGKDNGKLKQYFETTYPDLDFERVYASDLKKMVKWFEVLKKNKVEIKLSELPEEEEETAEVTEVAEQQEPAKKTAKKKEAVAAPEEEKTAKKKVAEPAADDEEKAPKKKAAPKKEAKASGEETKAPAKKAAPKKK